MNRIGRYLVVVGALLAVLAPAVMARIPSQESVVQPQSVVLAPGAPPPQADTPQVDTAPTLVSDQGRVTVSGVPHNGTGYFKFAIVNAAGTTSYWSNDGTSSTGNEPAANVPLSMSDGIFHVRLGDTSLSGMPLPLAASVFNASDRRLRTWFATAAGGPYTQLAPDRRIAASGYALNAETLDGQDSAAFALAPHNHFGQVWTGASGTGLAVNGGAIGVSGNGTTYGLYGQSDTTTGNGVVGYTSTSTGNTYGVYGQSFSSAGRGVYGFASNSLGTSYGVYGLSASSAGTGVYGLVNAASGTTYGVYGQSASSAGYGVYGTGATGVYGQSAATTGRGVYGVASATTGTANGVRGESASATSGAAAVYGYASATAGLTYGVYGQSASHGGNGVHGRATSSFGTNFGVYGQSDSSGGSGVTGYASATTGLTYGIEGWSASNAGRGVYGYATTLSGTTYGVYGSSSSSAGYGVYGTSAYIGVYGNTGTGGFVGVYGNSAASNGAGVYGYASAPTATNYGVFSNGNFAVCCGGTKSAIVETEDYGFRHLYAMESPDNWFEDFGQAQLVDGKATVTIEPVFAQTVNLNQPYMVFLTPLGDCAMYVAEQTPTSFSVRAMGGQTCNAGFYYRIIAKRLGFEDLRLGPAQDPATIAPAAPSQEAPRDVRGR